MAAVPTTSAMWFFQDPVTRGRRGPVKTEELQVLQQSGEITSKTLVWTKGMPAWARLEKVDALSLSKSSANTPRGPPEGGATTTSMMGTESREKEYYYVDPQKATKGPLSAEELKMLLKAGSITIDTKLWSPGQKEYIPASAAVPGINTLEGGAVNTSSDMKKVSSRSPSEASATTPRSAASLKAVSDVVSSFDPIPVGRASKELKAGGSEAEERRRSEEFEVAFATAYGSNGDTDKAVSTEGKSDKGGEERHDEISELRERIKHLELELASVNAEAIHMKDMIDARDGSEDGLTEPEATTSSGVDPFAKLAEMYNKHFEVLGHRQRLLEQFCIVLEHR